MSGRDFSTDSLIFLPTPDTAFLSSCLVIEICSYDSRWSLWKRTFSASFMLTSVSSNPAVCSKSQQMNGWRLISIIVILFAGFFSSSLCMRSTAAKYSSLQEMCETPFSMSSS